MSQAEEKPVHIIHRGATLCGRLVCGEGTDKVWPKDLAWTTWPMYLLATCPECVEEGYRHREHLDKLYKLLAPADPQPLNGVVAIGDSDAENYDRWREDSIFCEDPGE